jgi:hypothetical protein
MPSAKATSGPVAVRHSSAGPSASAKHVQLSIASILDPSTNFVNVPKRSADDADLDSDSESDSSEALEDVIYDMPMYSCNVVRYLSLTPQSTHPELISCRTKIRNLIDSGEYKIGQFCDEIGVSNKSYNGFMGQNGTYKGANFSAYGAANLFFRKRELRGVPEPGKKRKVTETVSVNTGIAKATPAGIVDISDVKLPGEETDEVEVYGTYPLSPQFTIVLLMFIRHM